MTSCLKIKIRIVGEACCITTPKDDPAMPKKLKERNRAAFAEICRIDREVAFGIRPEKKRKAQVISGQQENPKTAKAQKVYSEQTAKQSQDLKELMTINQNRRNSMSLEEMQKQQAQFNQLLAASKKGWQEVKALIDKLKSERQ